MAECKRSTSIHWQAGSASQIIRRDLPEQYARGFVPELRRDCAQQAPAIVPHDIGRAILPAELAARFVEKDCARRMIRSEEHTSELQSLMRISYAVFCLKTNKTNKYHTNISS